MLPCGTAGENAGRCYITYIQYVMHQVTSNMELLCCFVAGLSGTGPSTDKLHRFVYDQNRRAQKEEEDEIGDEKRFRLEDGLQRREVDD